MNSLFRKTYVEIDLKSIESNIKKVVEKFNNYKYFFGVIKANSYGCGDLNTLESMIKGGCNYLAVATLEEALEIREKIKEVPIICFGIIQKEYLEIASKNNITISINSLEYAKEIASSDINDLKVHIKINTGMNRLRNIKG